MFWRKKDVKVKQAQESTYSNKPHVRPYLALVNGVEIPVGFSGNISIINILFSCFYALHVVDSHNPNSL